jgi:hypothetical protein
LTWIDWVSVARSPNESFLCSKRLISFPGRYVTSPHFDNRKERRLIR